MLPENRDNAHLWDILEAAESIIQFCVHLSLDQYLKDRKLQLAVERLLEIIGEAAKNVSEDFRLEHPEIPWKKIIAQRNVISHEYGEIRQERIWLLISVSIPELRDKIKLLVPPS